MTPMTGMVLRYLIGADGDLSGADDEVTEVGFDATRPPTRGIGIKYCNLFNEKFSEQDAATRNLYGPYLTSSDTAKEYGEGQIDPKGGGWNKNLSEQFNRARSQGFKYVELDNPDAYDLPDVMQAIDGAQVYGLGVIAKNPGLTYDGWDATPAVAHANVFGIIVERGAGTPAEMDAMRRKAGKPDLPVWFVFFGSARTEAARTAGLARAFTGMGVTFSSVSEYSSSEDLLRPTLSTKETSMPETAPAHILVARSLVGKITDGPSILPLAARIGQLYPRMAAYCATVRTTTKWCGEFVGYCMAVTGREPPYDPDVDTRSFLWARAWLLFGTAVPIDQAQVGDVLVFDFGGGDSHVSLCDGFDGADRFWGLGGNQSDQVKRSSFAKAQCIGVRRPPAATGAIAAVDVPRPQIELGDSGQPVSDLQKLLGIAVTGVFDQATDAAVRSYQASRDLEVDGQVGDETWKALTTGAKAVQHAAVVGGLSADDISRIVAVAGAQSFSYSNGRMPAGCAKGIAVTFARVYLKWRAGDSAALLMARANTGDDDHDAISWYESRFTPLGMDNSVAGADTLRHLFCLIYGLSMRESSGNYSEGRDVSSRETPTADTAEAGLLQQSWNSHVASPEIARLMVAYSSSAVDGLISIFREGVSAKVTDNYGSGDGLTFQMLCKTKPAFAVEAAAVGLRVIGGQAPHGHWGPIRTHAAQVLPEVDRMLQQVQGIVDAIKTPIEIFPPGVEIPPVKTEPQGGGQPQSLGLMLLLLVLSNLKENKMTSQTPGQMLDSFNAAVMPMILRAIASGKPIDPHDLLQPLIQSLLHQQQPGAATPAPPTINDLLTTLLPALLQGKLHAGQPTTTAPAHTDLLSLLLPLLLQQRPALPAPDKPADPVVDVKQPETPPVTVAPASNTWTNLKAGLALLATSLGLSATGVIGTPVGPDATTTGMLLPLIAIGGAALGIPAPIVSVIGNFLAPMFNKKK